MSEDKLAENWQVAKLGATVSPSKEKTEPSAVPPDTPYLSLEHISSGSREIIGRGQAVDVKSTKSVFQAGDVLYGKLRPYLNKVCIPGFDGICSTDILVFPQSENIDNRFLMYFLSQESTVSFANHNSKGISLPRTSFKALSSLDIPLPPLPEQKRIVAKLDEIMAEIKAAKEHLARAKELIRKFRQSVLNAAVTGKLTEGWRREQGKAATGRDSLTDGYPKGWQVCLGSDLFDFVTSGSRGWAKYYTDSGPLFIRMGNLDHYDVDLKLEESQHVQPHESAERARTAVQKNDILISITADVGMVGLVPDGIGEAYINQHVAIARLNNAERADPEFIAWFLTADDGGQKQLLDLQRGATKVGLGLSDIRAVRIALPSAEEQREIVSRIRAGLRTAEKISEAISRSLAKGVIAMMDATLERAFRGELII